MALVGIVRNLDAKFIKVQLEPKVLLVLGIRQGIVDASAGLHTKNSIKNGLSSPVSVS